MSGHESQNGRRGAKAVREDRFTRAQVQEIVRKFLDLNDLLRQYGAETEVPTEELSMDAVGRYTRWLSQNRIRFSPDQMQECDLLEGLYRPRRGESRVAFRRRLRDQE